MAELQTASRHVLVARRWSWLTRRVLAGQAFPLPWHRRFALVLLARCIGADLVRSDLWTTAKMCLWKTCTLSTRDRRADRGRRL